MTKAEFRMTNPMSEQVLIIGGGVIGLSTAYYTARKGHQVTLLDRGTIEQENCSYGNAGLVVPSHFVPLAAPGMVAQGLKWMLKPDSPFYVKPRLDRDLLGWGFKFWRAANAGHVSRSAPLLRDLNLASRTCFEELAVLTGNAFGLEKKGVLCLCRTEHRLEEEARTAGQARQLGLNVEVLNARQATELDPHLRLDIVGAVYFRDDCHLIPALFMAALKQQQRKQVIITGMETHVCVLQTVIELLDAGYNVHLVSDAVMSRKKENWQVGLEMAAAAGAVVTSTEAALFQLLKVAGTEEFKRLSKLVR